MAESKGRGVWAWDIVKLITFLSILLYLSLFYIEGFKEESNRLVIRLTARTAAIFFIIAFSANAFHQWQKNSFSWWVFMNRKFFIGWRISLLVYSLNVDYFFSLFCKNDFKDFMEKIAYIWRILDMVDFYD